LLAGLSGIVSIADILPKLMLANENLLFLGSLMYHPRYPEK